MTSAQRIRLRLSEVRSRLNEISGLEGDDFTDEIRSEAKGLQTEYRDLETRHQSAHHRRGRGRDARGRARCRTAGADRAAVTLHPDELPAGRSPGAHGRRSGAGTQEAAEVRDGSIPVELFDVPETTETRADTATPAPSSGTGVNLDPVLPMIFARSVLPRLGVAMPRVKSGTYATGTVTTSLSAAAKAKGDAQESTAAAITTKTTGPHRVSARLSVRLEDVAEIGTANFESILRQNLQLVMSDRLDHLGLTGDGQGANPQDLLSQLTDPRRSRRRGDLQRVRQARG